MKRIQYDKYGGPGVMYLGEFDAADPGPGEVLVKVKFAALNPIDWKVRGGYLKFITGKVFPRVMGSDLSGSVVRVGPGVTRVAPGDDVFGLVSIKDGGALGEMVVISETCLAKKPENVSFEDAACLGTPGVTAWNGLFDKANLRAGSRVFINGCTGAVGEAAVQLARRHGAIVSGCTSAGGMSRAKALGLDNVHDYRSTDLAKFSGRYDVVYDTSATMATNVGLGMLRNGGAFLDIHPTPRKFIRAMFNRHLKPIVCTTRPDILDGLAMAAGQGTLRLPVAKIVPLNDAIRLISSLEAGSKLGGKGLVAMD